MYVSLIDPGLIFQLKKKNKLKKTLIQTKKHKGYCLTIYDQKSNLRRSDHLTSNLTLFVVCNELVFVTLWFEKVEDFCFVL